MLPGAILRNPRVGFEEWKPMVLPFPELTPGQGVVSYFDRAKPASKEEEPDPFAPKCRGTLKRARPQSAFADQHNHPISLLEMPEAPTMEEKRNGIGAMRDYTGHVPMGPPPMDELRKPLHKEFIKGYQGHLHGYRSTYGARFSTCVEKSLQDTPRRPQSAGAARRPSGRRSTVHVQGAHHVEKLHKREMVGGRFERMGRYHDATMRLESSNNTQKMLLNLIQCKVQERCFTMAQQKIRMRGIFESFDKDKSGDVDEAEFRDGLEMMNVQLSDDQACCAFAIFDPEGDGTVPYETFYSKLAIPNPRGGTAIYPKPITTTKQRFNLYDHNFKYSKSPNIPLDESS